MEQLRRDLAYAGRMFWKTPLVTAAALLSLALGIGANTTIFTLVNAVFLRGPLVEQPERLVTVFFTEEGKETQPFGNLMPFSRLNFDDLKARSGEVFEGLVNYLNFVPVNVRIEGGEPEQVVGVMVSGSYFDVLGVRAQLGRTFLPGEDQTPGTHPVVVLSHAWWQQRFGGDRTIVGKTLYLNNAAFSVIGVAPEGFNGTTTLGNETLWVPMMTYDTMLAGVFREWYDDRRAGLTQAFGRLRPGVTLEQAESAVALVGHALEEEYPVDNKNRTFTLMSFAESMINPGQRELFVRGSWMLMGAVGVVLLIACGNVANLLLSRAAARRREIAIRLSLGAARRTLVRQLLTESLALALLAGAAGLLIAYWARTALWSLRPPFLDQTPLDLGLDPRVLVFTLGVSLLTGVAFGIVPALQSTRPGIVSDLKEGGESTRRRRFGLREALVLAQVALSFVALIGSGLFLRSLEEATHIDVGFDPQGLVAMTFNVGGHGYGDASGKQFFDQVLERAQTVPGVEATALSTSVPLVIGDLLRTVLVEGRSPENENNAILTPVGSVSQDYFGTIGHRLLHGRLFDARDHQNATPVVVINEAMAERFWPDEDPIGKRFQFFGQEEMREVVGVVNTAKQNTLGEDPQSVALMPREQTYRDFMTLVARTCGEAEAILGTLRRELQALDPTLPITGVQTVEDAVGQTLWAARMAAALLALLGGLALLLAAVGIYGVMSYAVAQRSHELGIRIALGADRRRVLVLVLARGLAVVAVGLAAGIAVALLVSRALVSLLYGVSPSDLRTYALTVTALLVVAVLANLVPALRATRVDPVQVLRSER